MSSVESHAVEGYEPPAPARGIFAIPSDAYHADPAEVPSLSASIASIICSRSPAHARAAHPRLNPEHAEIQEERFDIGKAAHAILLEGQVAVEVIEAPDWRTNAAKDARDQARANGKIPLLAKVMFEVDAMVAAAAVQLAEHGARPTLFTSGKAEQTLVWDEPGGVVCRARLDWLRDDLAAIDDLKTTSRSANPEAYSKALFGVGGDIQAAMYIRGVQELEGRTPDFRWCVIETSPPYALSVIAPGPDVLTIGRKKVEYAIDVWRRCMASGEWPGYPSQVCFAELPAYEESRWLEKELREAA
jgi:hypothetical protein